MGINSCRNCARFICACGFAAAFLVGTLWDGGQLPSPHAAAAIIQPGATTTVTTSSSSTLLAVNVISSTEFPIVADQITGQEYSAMSVYHGSTVKVAPPPAGVELVCLVS
jgi:hypothetical protein